MSNRDRVKVIFQVQLVGIGDVERSSSSPELRKCKSSFHKQLGRAEDLVTT